MKRVRSDSIAVARILILLIAGISACSGPAAVPPSAPAADPTGDRFEIPGAITPHDNVLIESVEEDENHIFITWWTCESGGFMQQHSIDASKTVPGRAMPTVVRVSAAERQALIANWQQKGNSAQVTDLEGMTSQVSNVYLTFDPPAGYLYVPTSPRQRTTVLKMLVDGVEREIDFGAISNFERETGKIRLTLRDGDVLVGSYYPPYYSYDRGLVFRPRLQGVQYSPVGDPSAFSIPFKDVKNIVFLTAPGSG